MQVEVKYLIVGSVFVSLMTMVGVFQFSKTEPADLSLSAKPLPTCPQNSEVEAAAIFAQKAMQRCQADLKNCSNKPLPPPSQCTPVFTQAKSSQAETLSPFNWAQEWEELSRAKKFRPGASAALFSFLVVRNGASHFEILSQDAATVGQNRFFSTPSSDDIKSILDSNVSVDPESGDEINECTRSLESIFACFDIDGVVDISKSEWDVFVFNKAINKSINILTIQGGEEKLVEVWLRKNLGYDSVVLDTRGRNVLVQLPRDMKLGEGAQAFAWKESHAVFGVNAQKFATGGLLQLVAKEGKYGVFKIPVRKTSESEFKTGTKLRLWTHDKSAMILSH